jgi:3D (Asp-Asp-Asp) domain-containing protein
MGNKNYVEVDKEKLRIIRDDLQDAFNIFCGAEMKLTGYKESDSYDKLIGAIKDTTGITLSKSTLRDLITLKHNGKFQRDTFEALDQFISAYTKSPRTLNRKTNVEPIRQKVFWSTNQGFKAGVFINSFEGPFIEWKKIKEELETKVITQCPRIIPVGSRVEVGDFYGKKNWVIWIYDKHDKEIGSVWIGGNPLKQWYLDGLIRVGKTFSDTDWKVYQVMQRYSDGSYRIVQSLV